MKRQGTKGQSTRIRCEIKWLDPQYSGMPATNLLLVNGRQGADVKFCFDIDMHSLVLPPSCLVPSNYSPRNTDTLL